MIALQVSGMDAGVESLSTTLSQINPLDVSQHEPDTYGIQGGPAMSIGDDTISLSGASNTSSLA